jgi:hypothetical protein
VDPNPSNLRSEKLTRVLFWNVKKRDLSPIVCALVKSTKADVIVLNEPPTTIGTTLDLLKHEVSNDFHVPVSATENRFHLFCRHPGLDLTEIHAGFRTSFRRMRLGEDRLILALIHGVDVRNYDSDARLSFAHELATEISFVNIQHATNRLVLLGDFNMNPYERSMNLAAGLNAMMTRDCVRAGTRKHLKKEYELYYNPMWSLFGDNTDGPPGTVYDVSNQGPYGWSMFDQVLFNHSIVDLFEKVQILDEAGIYRLTDDRGRPDKKNASDHLPILVSLKGTKHE